MAFLSGSPGPGELLVVFVAVLLLFGPRKLPGIARSIGQVMQQLRRASDDFKAQLMNVEQEVRTEAREVVDVVVASDETVFEEAASGDEGVAVDVAPEAMPVMVIAEAGEAPSAAPALPDADGDEERPLGG